LIRRRRYGSPTAPSGWVTNPGPAWEHLPAADPGRRLRPARESSVDFRRQKRSSSLRSSPATPRSTTRRRTRRLGSSFGSAIVGTVNLAVVRRATTGSGPVANGSPTIGKPSAQSTWTHTPSSSHDHRPRRATYGLPASPAVYNAGNSTPPATGNAGRTSTTRRPRPTSGLGRPAAARQPSRPRPS